MNPYLAAVLLTANFTVYSGPDSPDERIEAIIDRGPIQELIVRCQRGTAIISYSKMDRRYCDPRLACDTDKERVIERTCG